MGCSERGGARALASSAAGQCFLANSVPSAWRRKHGRALCRASASSPAGTGGGGGRLCSGGAAGRGGARRLEPRRGLGWRQRGGRARPAARGRHALRPRPGAAPVQDPSATLRVRGRAARCGTGGTGDRDRMSPGWAFLGSTRSYSRSHLGAQALAVLSAERSRLASRGVPASRDGLLAVKASSHLNAHACKLAALTPASVWTGAGAAAARPAPAGCAGRDRVRQPHRRAGCGGAGGAVRGRGRAGGLRCIPAGRQKRRALTGVEGRRASSCSVTT